MGLGSHPSTSADVQGRSDRDKARRQLVEEKRQISSASMSHDRDEWHAGRDSNPRPSGSKPVKRMRNDGDLRVVALQGAAIACIEVSFQRHQTKAGTRRRPSGYSLVRGITLGGIKKKMKRLWDWSERSSVAVPRTVCGGEVESPPHTAGRSRESHARSCPHGCAPVRSP